MTRRCWAPSCRSRSIRRRVSSAAATILARDAVSWARLSAFAMAVAMSSVNSAMRPSVPTGIRSGADQAEAIAPQSRPATTIGTPILE